MTHAIAPTMPTHQARSAAFSFMTGTVRCRGPYEARFKQTRSSYLLIFGAHPDLSAPADTVDPCPPTS